VSITLAELGEAELLSRLARFAPPGQLNDDTALLPPDSRALLVNTDVMVEGVHFSDAPQPLLTLVGVLWSPTCLI
jgi:thiamine-monophosphate kinase